MNILITRKDRTGIFHSIKYFFIVIFTLLWAATTQADEVCEADILPSYDPDYYPYQQILACVPPAGWNGVLVVYAHGYVKPYKDLELPTLEFSDPDNPGENINVAELFVGAGFAFATTSYHKNGYAVEQAGDDIDNLVSYFNSHNEQGPASTILLIGGSEGSLITTMLIERNPDTYGGGVALCGPLGGANLEIRYLGDFRAVFDVFFPDIFSFGIVEGIPYDPIEEQAYIWAITNAFLTYPDRVEQLFNVTNVARNSADPESDLKAAISLLGYSVYGFNDIGEVAGGNPYGNRFRWYSGSSNDWLLNWRVERVAPSLAGKLYMRKYYQPTGKLTVPLITMHTTGDEIVPFWHQILYAIRVRLNNSQDMLTAIPVPEYGHCNFNAEQVLGAFALLASKLGIPIPESFATAQSSMAIE